MTFSCKISGDEVYSRINFFRPNTCKTNGFNISATLTKKLLPVERDQVERLSYDGIVLSDTKNPFSWHLYSKVLELVSKNKIQYAISTKGNVLQVEMTDKLPAFNEAALHIFLRLSIFR